MSDTLEKIKELITQDAVEAGPSGSRNRAIIVVDRGWIYAGDVLEENGRIRLHRPVWVFRWSSIGFDGVVANPSKEEVEIRPMTDRVIDIPCHSEVYRVPVPDDWGL